MVTILDAILIFIPSSPETRDPDCPPKIFY